MQVSDILTLNYYARRYGSDLDTEDLLSEAVCDALHYNTPPSRNNYIKLIQGRAHKMRREKTSRMNREQPIEEIYEPHKYTTLVSDISTVIDTMPEKIQETARLKFLEQYNLRNIGSKLKISHAEAGRRVREAKAILKRELAEYAPVFA